MVRSLDQKKNNKRWNKNSQSNGDAIAWMLAPSCIFSTNNTFIEQAFFSQAPGKVMSNEETVKEATSLPWQNWHFRGSKR